MGHNDSSDRPRVVESKARIAERGGSHPFIYDQKDDVLFLGSASEFHANLEAEFGIGDNVRAAREAGESRFVFGRATEQDGTLEVSELQGSLPENVDRVVRELFGYERDDFHFG